ENINPPARRYETAGVGLMPPNPLYAFQRMVVRGLNKCASGTVSFFFLLFADCLLLVLCGSPSAICHLLSAICCNDVTSSKIQNERPCVATTRSSSFMMKS